MINNHFNINVPSTIPLTKHEIDSIQQAIISLINESIQNHSPQLFPIHVNKPSIYHISSFNEDTNF